MEIKNLVDRLSRGYNSRDRSSHFQVKDVVLLVYDIAGYTKYCDYHESRDEHDPVNKLTYAFITGGKEIIRYFGGIPHNFTGDGYLSSFNFTDSSETEVHERAVDAALTLQELDREFNSIGFFGGYEPMLKVALYRGKTSFRSGRKNNEMPFGRAPSKLARIGTECRPGEILASGSAIDPVRDLYDTDEVRGIQLRGVSEQKGIHRVYGKKDGIEI